MPLIHEGPRRPIDFEWPGWITHPGVTLHVLFCELSGTEVPPYIGGTRMGQIDQCARVRHRLAMANAEARGPAWLARPSARRVHAHY